MTGPNDPSFKGKVTLLLFSNTPFFDSFRLRSLGSVEALRNLFSRVFLFFFNGLLSIPSLLTDAFQ